MNPHNHCIALDPPGADRRWRCKYCGAEGFFDELMGPDQSIECTFVYPPCEFCGQTPICTDNCVGIMMAFGAPGVHILGGPKPVIGKA